MSCQAHDGPPLAVPVAAGLESLLSSPSTIRLSLPHITHLMTGALVFQHPDPNHQNHQRKVLLLRRAPSDSYPLSWELPGGSVDPSDASIVHAAARELWEETGLQAHRVTACAGLLDHPVPEPEAAQWGIAPGTKGEAREVRLPGAGGGVKVLTFHETGEAWAKVTLVVEARGTQDVRLRPEEHVEYAWVAEREVRTGWMEPGPDGRRRVLGFLSPAVRSQILAAFYAQDM